jgi:hypothetical protein
VLSVAEVYQLADAISPRYRALVLLATFGNMRWDRLPVRATCPRHAQVKSQRPEDPAS